MNLKIEDLEKEMKSKKVGGSEEQLSSTLGSVVSSSSRFVHQSMKEALQCIESQKGSGAASGKDSSDKMLKQIKGASTAEYPPKEYEKMLQKLEADIRGHIRVSKTVLFIVIIFIDWVKLEHEMKIHLDYLEGRVEELEA